MKKLFVLMVIGLMVIGGAAHATVQGAFLFNLAPTGTSPVVPMGAAQLAAEPDAVNGEGDGGVYDSAYVPALANTIEADLAGPYFATTDRIQVDARTPLTSATDALIWNVTVHMNTATLTSNPFSLTAWFSAKDFNGDNVLKTDTAFAVKVFSGTYADKASAVASGPALWTGNLSTLGFKTQATADTIGSWTLASKTATSSFTVVAADFNQVVTPEPGSMLALFSGLVGLVGFGIRRRK